MISLDDILSNVLCWFANCSVRKATWTKFMKTIALVLQASQAFSYYDNYLVCDYLPSSLDKTNYHYHCINRIVIFPAGIRSMYAEVEDDIHKIYRSLGW